MKTFDVCLGIDETVRVTADSYVVDTSEGYLTFYNRNETTGVAMFKTWVYLREMLSERGKVV